MATSPAVKSSWSPINWWSKRGALRPGRPACSIARFELSAEGAKTRLVFDHDGFPADMKDHLAAGWTSNYWEPMHKLWG